MQNLQWRENKGDDLPLFWLENSPKTEANLPEIMNDLLFFGGTGMVFGLWGSQNDNLDQAVFPLAPC